MVLLRGEPLVPEERGSALLLALQECQSELLQGAIVSLDWSGQPLRQSPAAEIADYSTRSSTQPGSVAGLFFKKTTRRVFGNGNPDLIARS